MSVFRAFIGVICLFVAGCTTIPEMPNSDRLIGVKSIALEPLKAKLSAKNMALGSPVFIRIFKETKELELWVKTGATYSLFNTYPICNFSGRLGPKLREGDRQAPEGIYWVDAEALNPLSDSHLSFNLGFPNSFDLAHSRTGSYLMVHGGCGSIGCYAMTDPAIEEIYLLVEAALKGGQKRVQVHALPFRMSEVKLSQNAQNEWIGFWRELAAIDNGFEQSKRVPKVEVFGTNYVQNGYLK